MAEGFLCSSAFLSHHSCVAGDQACKKMSDVGMFLFLMQILPLICDPSCCISLCVLALAYAAVKQSCQGDLTGCDWVVPARWGLGDRLSPPCCSPGSVAGRRNRFVYHSLPASSVAGTPSKFQTGGKKKKIRSSGFLG